MYPLSPFPKTALFLAAGLLALATTGEASLSQTSAPGAPTALGPGAQPGAEPYSAQQPYPQDQETAGLQPYQSAPAAQEEGTFSPDEILSTGHSFFGRVSTGLARVIEYSFSKYGRPNGYILGEEAGGALIVGLRYGEGILHTKDAGKHKVFWQGPSIGYDFGAEGSKTMVLVYNLRDVDELYRTFGGIDGSAYFIGGIGLTYQKSDHVTLAPIRSGLGLRLGANVGYLKYTRRPTWNPF